MTLFTCLLVMASSGCSDDDNMVIDPPVEDLVTPTEVIENYVEIVHLSYMDAADKARVLKQRIDEFVSNPTMATHEATKRAWLDARVPYGQTEVYRFYDGPIDRAGGPEGQLNAWPMDEVYIDYVDGAPMAGIVNDLSIEISKQNLSSLNEGAMGDVTGIGDTFDEGKAISTGFHAVEFLLWGQDNDEAGPGSRPYTDFLTTADATAENGDRRGMYLQVVAELIVDDLEGLIAEWAPGGAYRTAFLAIDENEALTRMLSGAGILSKGELAAERMDVALRTQDQEDEHSCFADNTHVDILMNATGIHNVYTGRYRWFDGPGVDDLVRQANPTLADNVDAAFTVTFESIDAIPWPFDQAIRENGSDAWNAVDSAVDALFAQADLIVDVGLELGLDNVSVDLPEE